MKRKLRSVEDHLKEELKDPHFRELYELEQAKMEIVKKIVVYRIKHHLTQAQLARKVGVSQQQISKVEECEFSNFATVQKVLSAIGYRLSVTVFPSRHKKLQAA